MQLPFTEEQFLDVFAQYNSSLWLGAVVLWIVSAAVAAAWLRGRAGDRLIVWTLVAHWLWAAVAYHLTFFTAINPAAYLFAVLFGLEAILLAWFGIHRRRLGFSTRLGGWTASAATLVIYSLIYPLVVAAAGFVYPRMPTFGVPCPTDLFTVGLLLATSPAAPWPLMVIPLAWCAVGGSAAVLFGVYPDWALLGAAALLLLHMARRAVGGRDLLGQDS